MPLIRQRKDFPAEVMSLDGKRISDCHVFCEIEIVVEGDARVTTWSGKFTSLSAPEHVFRGGYLIRPRSGEGVRIDILAGDEERMGITSDEYSFRGEGAPPELP
ncbi:MAG: hypothetical protein O6913_05625 [Chloroflexi bacterium]|nr:hypothetical protein [Chloroflexota bacterium]MCZ6707903.1 hypothetical protein [Chloroflexota bacterium]